MRTFLPIIHFSHDLVSNSGQLTAVVPLQGFRATKLRLYIKEFAVHSIGKAFCTFFLIFGICLGTQKVGAQISRGDVDLNLQLEITDPILILSHLFLGTFSPSCSQVADVDSSQVVDISDPIQLLSHLFLGDPAPENLSLFEERLCLEPSQEQAERGMLVYENPDPEGNTFACLTCHNLVPDADATYQRPGHSLVGALGRPSYKNGELDHFLDAVNVCREFWMITEPWEEEDEEFLDLTSLVRGFNPVEATEALELQIEESTHQGPSTGDPVQGCETFHSTCIVCHGEGALGTERAPSLVFDPINPLDPDYIRLRVRTSGNSDTVYENLTGGVMPFWSHSRLSDTELEDIVAYLSERPVHECREIEPPPVGVVLRSGELTNESNGVMGKVEELSTGVIRVVMFNYDGEGDEVRPWLYLGDDLDNGLSFGENLVREAPGWEDATLEIPLPDDLTMDAYDHFAIRSISDGSVFGRCELLPIDNNGEGTVVRSGQLIERFHGVRGLVEELDTRKLRFSNFYYDGAGIDVRVWLYQSGNPQGGYEIGPDLLRPSPGWVDATFVVDIPERFTPDMYDSISIWCVPVRVSFGDTKLE